MGLELGMRTSMQQKTLHLKWVGTWNENKHAAEDS